MEFKKLIRAKTFWAGATIIVLSAAGYASGTVDVVKLAEGVMAGLTTIFVRIAIEKSGGKRSTMKCGDNGIGDNGIYKKFER